MMRVSFFGLFRRKSRERAKKRLKALVGVGRRVTYKLDDIVDPVTINLKTEQIKREILLKTEEVFQVAEKDIRIESEELGRRIRIVTDITFE
ncbi:MAG: hypothetical protein J7K51_09435 [Thermotogae bacterium]|nr:hypothetical protein [Thermotogota bacterium]